MQSMEIVIVIFRDEPRPRDQGRRHVLAAAEGRAQKRKRRHALSYVAPLPWNKTARRRLLVVLGLDHFATTVETVRADVVTQVGLAGGRLDGQVRRNQEIVRTVHA